MSINADAYIDTRAERVSSYPLTNTDAHFNLYKMVFPEQCSRPDTYKFDFVEEQEMVKKRIAAALLLLDDEFLLEAVEHLAQFIRIGVEYDAMYIIVG